MKQPLISTFGCFLLALICVSCQPVEDDYGQRTGRAHGNSRKEAKVEKERKRELERLRAERADLDQKIAKLDEEARRAERNSIAQTETQGQMIGATSPDAGATTVGGNPPGSAGASTTDPSGTGAVPPSNPAAGHESTLVNPSPDNAGGSGAAADATKVAKKNYPTATAVPGKPGLVYSPFNNKPVDVKGIPSGTIVADPQYPPADKKHFRVP